MPIPVIALQFPYVSQLNGSAKQKEGTLTPGIKTTKTFRYKKLLLKSLQNTRAGVKYCTHWRKRKSSTSDKSCNIRGIFR